MSHKKLSPFIVKVPVLGYFPLPIYIYIVNIGDSRLHGGLCSEPS